MKLYNCFTKEERELKQIEISSLTTIELMELIKDIKIKFDDYVLNDEYIVVSALIEISNELGKRLLA